MFMWFKIFFEKYQFAVCEIGEMNNKLLTMRVVYSFENSGKNFAFNDKRKVLLAGNAKIGK